MGARRDEEAGAGGSSERRAKWKVTEDMVRMRVIRLSVRRALAWYRSFGGGGGGGGGRSLSSFLSPANLKTAY